MGKTRLSPAGPLLGAALAVALLGVGCGSTQYAQRREADQRLSATVGERLAAEPALSSSRLEARSHRGVVALLGEVPDDGLKRDAERVAREVPGVARVNNLILVVKGDSETGGSTPAKGALLMARTD
jgi:osmotically-inducible protein OsmY